MASPAAAGGPGGDDAGRASVCDAQARVSANCGQDVESCDARERLKNGASELGSVGPADPLPRSRDHPLVGAYTPGIYNKAGELVKPVGAKDDSAAVFASVFLIIWCGSAVVTVNAVLLGGTVSFFQSICILGYCVFPLNVAALVAMAVGWTACTSTTCFLIRFSSVVLGLGWATRASNGFMSQVVPNKRSALAIYPVYLFYMALAWIILIRSSP
eukprot:CAMPEP_0180258418 /NCGR_PEP_ID=MMETSP0987-20121128/42397_1 /TAXON_ID=697907 /ORGANISM="non described non described, Strain CCMP2293" /LENGTH=214 /DNA_ID=CAMNT_0022227899 /DNA_START=111 /DNA_END=756 /DNA_ORIENTATION=+